jgi:hypothetical protein
VVRILHSINSRSQDIYAAAIPLYGWFEALLKEQFSKDAFYCYAQLGRPKIARTHQFSANRPPDDVDDLLI